MYPSIEAPSSSTFATPQPSDIAGVVVLDHAWRIALATVGLAANLGLPPGSFGTGRSILSALHPDDLVEVMASLQAVADGRTDRSPIRFRPPGGEERRRTIRAHVLPVAGDTSVTLVFERPARRPHTTVLADDLEHRISRLSAEILATFPDRAQATRKARAVADDHGLSERQWEILSRLAQGYRVPQIARDLYLSQSTVRNHLVMMFRKLGVSSQVELMEVLRRA